MATRTETLNTFYASTWRDVRPGITDNIFDSTPFLFFMSQKGRRRMDSSGGRFIDCNLEYGENGTIAWIGKGGTVSLDDTDPIKPAKWDWKWASGNLVRYNTEEQMNRGKAAIFNMATAKFKNLKKGFSKEMESVLFETTQSRGLKFDSLGTIVYSAPATGTIAGINRADDSWWRNQYKAFTAPFTVNGMADLLNLFNNCSVGNDTPDFHICDQTSHELYESMIWDRTMVRNEMMVNAGFTGLTYKGRPVEWSPSCTSGYWYMVNTDYMELVFNPDMYFAMTKWKEIPNQPFDLVAQVVVQGNLISTNCRMHGVGTGLAA